MTERHKPEDVRWFRQQVEQQNFPATLNILRELPAFLDWVEKVVTCVDMLDRRLHEAGIFDSPTQVAVRKTMEGEDE